MEQAILMGDEFDRLPPFANQENKELDAKVRDSEKQLQKLTDELAHYDDRVSVMDKHLKNVQDEIKRVQDLIAARVKEVETELNLKQIAERETGKHKSEARRVKKQQKDIQDKLNQIHNDIFKRTERLEQFKSEMNWNQEELEQWILAAAQKEEDHVAMQKYARKDETKVRELSLNIEKLTNEVNKKREVLAQEVTETQALQIELDKTAEEFRALHKERQDLLVQWETAVDTMRKRDEQIQKAGEVFASLKDELRSVQERLVDKRQFLDQEQANNQEVERAVEQGNRQVGKLRAELHSATKALEEMKDEVDALRATVQKAGTDLQRARGDIVAGEREVEEKRRRIEKLQETHDNVAKHVDEMEQLQTDATKNVDEIEWLLKEEENRSRQIDDELAQQKDEVFQRNQLLHKLRQQEANTTAEVQGTKAALKNLQAQVHQLDTKGMKQQELLYNQEFKLQQLQRKVSRAQGERSDDEKKALQARIQQLQSTLEEKQHVLGVLTAQYKKVQDNLRAHQRKLEKDRSEQATWVSKIEELEVDNDSGTRELKDIVKRKESCLVEENLLQLEVQKLRENLQKKQEAVIGLKNRQEQLRFTMDERALETESHREMLRAELHTLSEERHALVMELATIRTKVEKTERRYEVVSAKLAGPTSEDGAAPPEDVSQAYFVVKSAQEREELQQRGDKLDQEIRVLEKEVKILEKSLSTLFSRNTEFRESFNKTDKAAAEVQERDDLEDEYKRLSQRLRYKKLELREVEEELAQLEGSVAELASEHQALQARLDDHTARCNAMEADLNLQKEKCRRAQTQVQKFKKQLKQSKNVGESELTPEEKDFLLAERKQLNQNVLTMLITYAQMHPDLTPLLQQTASSSGIKLPARPSSSSARPRSRPSSSGSTSNPTPRSARRTPSATATVQPALHTAAPPAHRPPTGTTLSSRPKLTPSAGSLARPPAVTPPLTGTAARPGSRPNSRPNSRPSAGAVPTQLATGMGVQGSSARPASRPNSGSRTTPRSSQSRL